MSIQEPAWRKRTRPCPFFSQGRCLFADACNFLHDIKVRSAVDQSLLSATRVKQQRPLPPKHVFDPPTLVLNSASPRSVNFASSVHDSSRYSGLLSVLSDVIGHPPRSPADEHTTSDFRDVAYSNGVSSTESNSALNDLESCSIVGDELPNLHPPETDECGVAAYEEASSVIQPFVGEALSYLDGRYLGQGNVPQCKDDDGQPAADSNFYANSDDDDVHPAGGATCYVVEDMETYVIGLDDEEEGGGGEKETEENADNNPMVMASQRHSVLSSFTGASLLASPRSSVFEEASAESPVQDGPSDLLSPVQLSATLRPFSIHSSDAICRKGDSIDSGYADGDSWVGPLPFPDSPPNSARSSMGFLPVQLRRMSLVSPTLQERRVSYDVRATRPSPHITIETIEEHPYDESSEDSDDATCSIIGAYDTSPSESEAEVEADYASPTLQVSIIAIAERTIEESDGITGPSTVLCGPRLNSPQLLHPTGDYDMDLHGQHSSVSDDNASLEIALSTQPSCEDFSDISARVSPVKPDSLLSLISGRSTPNTSLHSHDGDAPEVLERDSCSLYMCNSPHLVEVTSSEGQLDSQEDSKGGGSADCSLPTAVVSDLNALQPLLATQFDFPQESVTKHVDHTRGYWERSTLSYVCAPDLDPPAELPHGSYLVTDSQGRAPSDRNVSFMDSSVSAACGGLEIAPTQEDRSLVVIADHYPGSQEARNLFDPEHGSFSAPSPSQFPLPPFFLPMGLLGHSTVCENEDEDESVHSEANDVEVQEDVTRAWSVFTRPEEAQRVPDLMVEPSPNQVPPTGSPDPAVDFISQRGRAASDLTVKGRPSSPLLTPEEGPSATSISSPTIHKQPVRSDSVQLLYDHYLHADSFEDLGLSGFEHGDFEVSAASRATEECPLESQLRSTESLTHIFHELSTPFASIEPTRSYSGSPRSETTFRPLLTGRRSLLNSSLSELVPKASPTDANEPSSVFTPSSTRLQTRETGSTMVPLSFRRFNPQFAVKQSLRNDSQPWQSVLPATGPREVLRIRTDIAEQTSPPRCFSAAPATSTARPPSPSQSQSAPPTSGLKPLRLCIHKVISFVEHHIQHFVSRSYFQFISTAISQCII
ncbi:hypothetical protein BS17DRAFT_392928 [Gyrodon lividus]|nr:hypothetical protein BS17DRAFT_392928 [Gyrodon lividus]